MDGAAPSEDLEYPMDNIIPLNNDLKNEVTIKEALTFRLMWSRPFQSGAVVLRQLPYLISILENGIRTFRIRYEIPAADAELQVFVDLNGFDEKHARLILNMMFPAIQATRVTASRVYAVTHALVPDGYETKNGRNKLHVVRTIAPAVMLDRAPWNQPMIDAALFQLQCFSSSSLLIDFESVQIDAKLSRAVEEGFGQVHSKAIHETDQEKGRFVRAFLNAGEGVRLKFSYAATNAPTDLRHVLSFLLFGSACCERGFRDDHADLRCVWPVGVSLPSFMQELEPQHRNRAKEESGVLYGQSLTGGRTIGQDWRDFARHSIVLGASGSGKTTLIKNMFLQSTLAQPQQAIVLLDAHGDLANEALSIVPLSRRNDVIYMDLSTPASVRGLNVLAVIGKDPEAGRSRAVNMLLSILKNIMYRDMASIAFGPMFDQYFCNGLLLLMEGMGETAVLSDFEKVYTDYSFRQKLLEACKTDSVVRFWREVAEGVSGSADHSLANMVPYITSKISTLTSSPSVRALIGCENGGFSLGEAMNEGKIIIFRVAKGEIGTAESQLIASLITVSVLQAGLARAQLPQSQRKPVAFIFDEAHQGHGEPIADLLAEGRKFAISTVLAFQSLSQVSGRFGQNDVADAALANAGNVISFRVSPQDAKSIAPLLTLDGNWQKVTQLRDYHAVVRLLDRGRLMPVTEIACLPPPEPEINSAKVERGEGLNRSGIAGGRFS